MNRKALTKRLPKVIKMAIRCLPLAGAASTVFFNFTRVEQQFMILVVLVWVQVFFILEIFLAGK